MMLGRKKSPEGTEVGVPRWVFILMLAVIALLGLFVWSRMRERPVLLRVDSRGGLRQMVPSVVGLTHGALIRGNSAEVFQNGAFFDGVIRDIAGAKESVHFETFVWWKGEVCVKVAQALASKAREGVQVRVLLDASGSSRMDEKLFEMMQAAGVRITRFHPFSPRNFGRWNNRDHRKIVVIDGRTGWVGGHGIADEWTGNAQDKKHWRDTFVRVQGPVVSQLQAAFSENWIEETGEVPIGDIYFPTLTPTGSATAHVAFSSPSGSVSSVELLHYLAIVSAQKEIVIQNPYFIPDRAAIEALTDAVKRGVKVSVMMPSADATDNALVQHASHQLYDILLARGVRIYEYHRTLLHQKVMIVDEHWATVGSTNFDDRSFELNDEISLGLLDRDVALQLKRAFLDDMRYASEVRPAEWKRRSRGHKLQDRLAYVLNEQL
jgi:cardiolipin synthase